VGEYDLSNYAIMPWTTRNPDFKDTTYSMAWTVQDRDIDSYNGITYTYIDRIVTDLCGKLW